MMEQSETRCLDSMYSLISLINLFIASKHEQLNDILVECQSVSNTYFYIFNQQGKGEQISIHDQVVDKSQIQWLTPKYKRFPKILIDLLVNINNIYLNLDPRFK